MSLKRTQPARAVFLEHEGPYWALGPPITLVQAEMKARKQSGPLFVRYSADPTATSSRSLRTDVGFFADGDWRVAAPFQSAEFEPADVASAKVSGPLGTTTRYYTPIYEWIKQQGHETIGPILEIYPARAPGRTTGDEQIEIQVPVRRGAAAEANRPKVAGVDGRESQAARTEEATQPEEPISSIKVLVEAGRYARLAEQLMPVGRRIPPHDQVWLGQLVFRVGAVAKGLQHAYPDSAGPVTALADALVSRYKASSAGSSTTALAQSVVRVDPTVDPAAARKREIMRHLDALLGRVATKAADPTASLNALAELLQETIQVMETAPRR